MDDRIPAIPSIGELFRHGLVAPLAVIIGLVFLTIGAAGDLSLSNRKLLVGAGLLFFGVAWHNASQARDVVSHDVGSYRTWNVSKVVTSTVFFLLFLLTGYQALAGNRNVFQKNENCERHAIELQNEFKESGDNIPGVSKGC